ncbi:hypothetical protein DPEC_G00006780 [Dallia pectoralis]|uniref:Uncharacterized protein n=1 Tax=Dallia pectoralis TaxID=75939 RepID=A0ACC2HKU9_DALPE|nr:hypothetical protein DPEC_G00006780 [Dallia pectoralis]
MVTLDRMSQIPETPSEPRLKDSSPNMLAILEVWDDKHCIEDNTGHFLLIMLLKVGLDGLIMSLCQRRLHTSFMGICGLSVILADVVLSCAVAAIWTLGHASSQASMCFLLAHASDMFNALPLPILGLGLLDYAFHTTPCSTLWYCVLTLMLWVVAGVHSYSSAFTEMIEVEYERGMNALGCAVQESVFVVYFSVGIFIAICWVLLSHYKLIFSLIKEANRLSEQRNNVKFEPKQSLTYKHGKLMQLKADQENALVGETKWQSPPLYLTLTLGFSITWASYLVMCVACELLDLAVPSYISINILWLKCVDSLLIGLMFWLRSDRLGPYSDHTDELCPWPIYWHLSRGYLRDAETLPNAMFTLTGKDRNPLLQV